MQTAIKPIETVYDGYRFRSRLEARWAVFFDSLGVKYEYEPEGFELPGLGGYLPDFRVMCHASRGGECEPFPLYIEVKGSMDQASAEKIKAFGWPLLIVGNIPNIYSVSAIHSSDLLGSYDTLGYGICPFNYETVDGDYFAAYPCAQDGKFGLLGDDSHYIHWGDHVLTAYAYLAARQARFEHGERPQLVPRDYKGNLKLMEARKLFGVIT
jgi:hypothetical protein